MRISATNAVISPFSNAFMERISALSSNTNATSLNAASNAAVPNSSIAVLKKEGEALSQEVERVNGISALPDEPKVAPTTREISLSVADKFSPSDEMQKAKEIGGQIEGGFRDVKRFDEVRDILLKESLLTPMDMISMAHFRQGEKLSFDEFNKIASNDKHTMEIKNLLNSTINKLHYIDAITQGALSV